MTDVEGRTMVLSIALAFEHACVRACARACVSRSRARTCLAGLQS